MASSLMMDVLDMGVKLQGILDEMDVPEHRRDLLDIQNLRWLQRNLGINNGNNPRIGEAMKLISAMGRTAAR